MNFFPKNKSAYSKAFKQEWFNATVDLIKVNGYNKVLDIFCMAAEKVAEDQKNIKFDQKSGQIYTIKKITEIADDYDLKPLGKKVRICPFHGDKDPSLSLSDEKGLFNCFGCGVKGNIIKFKAMLKKVRDGNNKRGI